MITPEQAQPYAELPFVVESELGTLMLPLREVLALGPGSVIRLPVPSRSPIRVLVGDTFFATGEAIRAANAPAVRVLSVNTRGSV